MSAKEGLRELTIVLKQSILNSTLLSENCVGFRRR